MSAKSQTTSQSNALTINFPNVAFVLLNHVAFVSSFWLIKFDSITTNTWIVAILLYFLTIFSLTTGYHRMYAHKSLSGSSLFRIITLFFGAGTFIGSALNWCKLHRTHHRFIGSSKDPFNIRAGLFHAHVGWLFYNHKDDATNEPGLEFNDLYKDSLLKLQSNLYFVFFLVSSFGVPALLASFTQQDLVTLVVVAGLWREVAASHAFLTMHSLCHVMGMQSFGDSAARDMPVLSLFTLGEGYQNFHHEFPTDFRLGRSIFDFDLAKIILYVLSLVGIVSGLKKEKDSEIRNKQIAWKQRCIDRAKRGLDFGPDEEQLPIWTWESIDQKTAKGEKLVIVDGIVHDVSDFIKKHPGGARVIVERLGKDSTIGFNGGVYRHTKAARNLAAMYRVARLPKHEIAVRAEKDHIPPPW